MPMNIFGPAHADEYLCVPTRVIDSSGEWSKERIEKWKPSTIISFLGEKPDILSRCSFSMIEGKRTCDVYAIEKYVRTKLLAGLGFIDKFYYFHGQYDVQLFIGTGVEISYIENNGRGTIYRGDCVKL